MIGPVVGIDLGTTNSAVAHFTGGRLRFLPNDLGETLTPSAVAYDRGRKGLVVGRAAKDLCAREPALGRLSFKRDMGKSVVFPVGERDMTPVELSAYVLDALRTDAERALETTVRRAVVTVPAYFNEAQRAATKQAAALAGLDVERIVNEPTAAALAYGFARDRERGLYLVLDLGGGTFDVSVVEVFEGLFAVKGVGGDGCLGGDDFTEALVCLVCERTGVERQELLLSHPEQNALLVRRAELLKRKLGRWPEADLALPVFGDLREEVRLCVDRAEAEAAYRPLLDRMQGPIRSALLGAGLDASAFDEIVLVGGATRMPSVQEFVRRVLGREPSLDAEPDLVVARGAALQAALAADDAAIGDLVVTDVASHSLGVGVMREIGGKHLPGFFLPVIHRNTVIPCSHVEVLTPVRPDQRELVLQVFEGESRKVAENHPIGELSVKPVPLGVERGVEVRFTYDVNGMLEVEATVRATGTKVARVFSRSVALLSPEQEEEAALRLAALKARPHDRPRYRDLLGRASALWQDLTGADREKLGFAIDAFEAALAVHQPQTIEEAYDGLLAVCEGLDLGERY